MATLATQSASDSSSVNRTTLDAEFQDVIAEIDREAAVAGLTSSGGFSVFVSNNGSNGVVGGMIGAADSTGLSLTTLDVSSSGTAAAAVAALGTAVQSLGAVQASVGTLENRLMYAVTLAQSQIVNTQAAESRIRDANIAEESSSMTRYQILTQSGIAVLAQANQTSAAVLSLLR